MDKRGSIVEYNKAGYDAGWRYFTLQSHAIWSVWKEIEPFAGEGKRLLEVGPGKWPHLPPSRSHFVDLSEEALGALRGAGGTCTSGTPPWPYQDSFFDVACFFETLEHIEDDAAFLAEVARVVRPGGHIFLSCPMNPNYWTVYDAVVGHARRYRAEELTKKLDVAGFSIERVCARDDRMSRVYGWLFAFAVLYLMRLTAVLLRLALPVVAGKYWPWIDGDDLTQAEQRGGVTLRARRRGELNDIA